MLLVVCFPSFPSALCFCNTLNHLAAPSTCSTLPPGCWQATNMPPPFCRFHAFSPTVLPACLPPPWGAACCLYIRCVVAACFFRLHCQHSFCCRHTQKLNSSSLSLSLDGTFLFLCFGWCRSTFLDSAFDALFCSLRHTLLRDNALFTTVWARWEADWCAILSVIDTIPFCY